MVWRNKTGVAWALVVLFVGGCGIFQSKRAGPDKVSDLVGMIERVYVESEVSKQKALVAVAKLESIVANDFGQDPVAAYGDLVAAIDSSVAQAERLRSTVGPMKDAAGPVFKRWEDNLGEYSSAAMRQNSQARLDATRARYDAIVAAVEPTLAAYDVLNQGLRDHALFLSHDFNPSSLEALRDDVKNLAGLAGGLEKQLDECLLSSRAYINTAALPVRATPEPAPVPVSGSTK